MRKLRPKSFVNESVGSVEQRDKVSSLAPVRRNIAYTVPSIKLKIIFLLMGFMRSERNSVFSLMYETESPSYLMPSV